MCSIEHASEIVVSLLLCATIKFVITLFTFGLKMPGGMPCLPVCVCARARACVRACVVCLMSCKRECVCVRVLYVLCACHLSLSLSLCVCVYAWLYCTYLY